MEVGFENMNLKSAWVKNLMFLAGSGQKPLDKLVQKNTCSNLMCNVSPVEIMMWIIWKWKFYQKIQCRVCKNIGSIE